MQLKDSFPLVSVVTATYNRSKLLQQTVESVLAQTYPAVEMIVVDDGSTDDTEIVLKEYVGRITHIKQANRGVTAARNAGFRASSGQFVNFLDHDDLLAPTKIERQMQAFQTRPEAGVVHCRYNYIDEKGRPIDKVGPLPEGDVFQKLVCGCFLWSGAPLIRRECLEEVGLYDEKTWSACEDWELWLRIAKRYPFACVQESIGSFRMISNTRTITDLGGLKNGMFVALDRVFQCDDLPVSVKAVQKEAYSNAYLELSYYDYLVGRWDQAQQDLRESLGLNPLLAEALERLLHFFSVGALNPHTTNPSQFIEDALNHLPPELDSLRAHKPRLLGQVLIGMAFRDYGFGRIEQARNELTEAFNLYPEWLEEPKDVLKLVHATAMDSQIDNAIELIDQVFDDLPSNAQRFARYRSSLLSQVFTELAVRSYGVRDIPKAREQLTQAIMLNPQMVEQPSDFKRLLGHYAMNSARAPFEFVETVFQNLPANAKLLARVQPDIVSEVGIACALQDYSAGRPKSALQGILAQVRHRPAVLANRGVVSVLVRSLPRALIGQGN